MLWKEFSVKFGELTRQHVDDSQLFDQLASTVDMKFQDWREWYSPCEGSPFPWANFLAQCLPPALKLRLMKPLMPRELVFDLFTSTRLARPAPSPLCSVYLKRPPSSLTDAERFLFTRLERALYVQYIQGMGEWVAT